MEGLYNNTNQGIMIRWRDFHQVIAFFCFVLFVAVIFYIASLNDKKFIKNHTLTTGTVTECIVGTRKRQGHQVFFKYWNGNHLVETSSFYSELAYPTQDIVDKQFPVLYGSGYFGNREEMLITPKDFERYGYIFPDSLEWLRKYLKH